KPGLARPVAGLFLAGVLTGVVAAAAGFLAFFTVPAHTEEAHVLMYWHLASVAAALVVFAGLAWARCRAVIAPPNVGTRLLGILAAVLLAVGGGLGGYIVYHGGAGVTPSLLGPEIRGGHVHE